MTLTFCLRQTGQNVRENRWRKETEPPIETVSVLERNEKGISVFQKIHS